MLILIKKDVFTQQQLFMVISVLKIKGQLITCKIIYQQLYIVFVTKCIVFRTDFSHLLDILKASLQQC